MVMVSREEARSEVHILLSTGYSLSVSFLQQVSTEALLINLLVRKEAACAVESFCSIRIDGTCCGWRQLQNISQSGKQDVAAGNEARTQIPGF